MERSRWIAAGVMIVGCAAFVAGLVPMIERVRAFNAAHPPLQMHVEPITSREFTYADLPAATITDAKDAAGHPIVRLDFAGKATDIPVKAPPAPNLPGLAAYDEWLKVLGIQESSVTKETIGAKKGTERLFIITRRTPEGYDPDAWGSVRRIEWVFEFYELKRDGTIERSTWRWPRSYRAEKRLKGEADPSQPMPPNIITAAQKAEWQADIARAQHLLAIKPLQQRSLEYFLALHVMPKLSVPNYKFNDTAFNLEVLGWTMPLTMCSVLAIAGGLVFLVAPRRRRANEPHSTGQSGRGKNV